MRKQAVLLGCVALSLLGCEQPVTQDANRPLVWRAPALQALREWSAQAEAPLFVARIEADSSAGEAPRQRLQVHSTANAMRVEGEVFARLARLGYSRTLLREQAGLFVVEYRNSQDLPVSAEYRERAEQGGVKSTVLFSWPQGD
ncbi:hypothetical protein [Pseudomonas fluvialis]|uniref:hypothetical protein n=1 Tax=Pseudomonas fluvialis TaxID=1793966 RepID=UPI0035B4544F